MKKILIIGAIAVIVIIIVGILLALSNLGPIVRKAVNTYGPEMTKTEVRVGDVGLSLFSGKATLKDVYLGNPKGYSAREALVVPSIAVAVDRTSLATDTVIINRIELAGPSITFEKQGRTDNFKTIMENISRYGGSKGKETTERGEGTKKDTKLLIREFIIRDGRLTILIPGLSGRSLTAAMPEIRLKDVGTDGSGGTPSEVFGQVFGALYGKIISTSAGGITGGAEAAGSALGEGGKATKKGLDQAAGTMKKLFGK